MTSSGDIGVPNEPADGLELFYRQHGIKTLEGKIQALERQLQQFPDHHQPRDRRLRELEMMARNKINGADTQAVDRKKQRDKFRDLYKKVEDKPVPGGDKPISPVEQAILGGQIRIERDYD